MVKVEDIFTAIKMNLLPPNSIYMIPVMEALDARGRIIPTRDKYGRVFSPRVRVVINDSEGGFIFYSAPPGKQLRALRRELKEAPEEGYVREIELEPFSQGDVYFYFKIGGKFGKGEITSPAYYPKDKYRVYRCRYNPRS